MYLELVPTLGFKPLPESRGILQVHSEGDTHRMLLRAEIERVRRMKSAKAPAACVVIQTGAGEEYCVPQRIAPSVLYAFRVTQPSASFQLHEVERDKQGRRNLGRERLGAANRVAPRLGEGDAPSMLVECVGSSFRGIAYARRPWDDDSNLSVPPAELRTRRHGLVLRLSAHLPQRMTHSGLSSKMGTGTSTSSSTGTNVWTSLGMASGKSVVMGCKSGGHPQVLHMPLV